MVVWLHHKEMIARKNVNYERCLRVEISKTNEMITKLLPYHMLETVKSEKRQVDHFQGDLTLLVSELVGLPENFEPTSKNFTDQFQFLQKLFNRFDQLCEERGVFKIHTVGTKYLAMGYTGKVSMKTRTKNVIIEEANRIIETGFEMIDIL